MSWIGKIRFVPIWFGILLFFISAIIAMAVSSATSVAMICGGIARRLMQIGLWQSHRLGPHQIWQPSSIKPCFFLVDRAGLRNRVDESSLPAGFLQKLLQLWRDIKCPWVGPHIVGFILPELWGMVSLRLKWSIDLSTVWNAIWGKQGLLCFVRQNEPTCSGWSVGEQWSLIRDMSSSGKNCCGCKNLLSL